MSIGGNSNFTRIQSHSTSSAFSSGLTSLPVSTNKLSPYTVIDVNVNIAGALTGAIFDLGDAIPAGCIITQASLNGYGSVTPGTTATYQLGLSLTAGTDVVTGLAPVAAAVVATAPPGAVGSINAGVATATAATVVAAATYPVLKVVLQDLTETGTVQVKIVCFCP